MRNAATALVFLLDLGAFTWLSRRLRRQPLPLAAAVGLGLLVAWQALVSMTLSAFGAVNGHALLAAACLPPLLAAAWPPRRPGAVFEAAGRGWRALRWAATGPGRAFLLVVPLALLLLLVAATYAPSNWDSMTYRLARVAHWLQHGSVAAYPTNVYRQTFLAPGAEYLLLGLQAVSGSDLLSSGLQLVSWLVVVGCAPLLARLAGAPRRVAAWAGPLVGGTPMLVLQATSTQTDLLAAALTVAVIAAATPLLHRRARVRPTDLLLLGALMGAGFLVKATVLACAAPFLAVALPSLIRSLRRPPWGRSALALVGAGVLLAALAGPHLVQMARAGPRALPLTEPFVFPPWGAWSARGENVRLALTRHFVPAAHLDPGVEQVRAALAGRHPELAGVAEGLAFVANALTGPIATAKGPFDENEVKNPVQAAFAVVGLLLLWSGRRGLAPRARWGGLLLLAAWLLFQAIFRSNPWISRLESPLFALLPLLMGGWRVPSSPAWRLSLGAFGFTSLALGLLVAATGHPHPAAGALARREPVDDYYRCRQDQRPVHDVALELAAATGCRRIGLFIGEDSYDYPLTWRAMQRGFEVRHVLGAERWPCLLVGDRPGPPPPGPGEAPWQIAYRSPPPPGRAREEAGSSWVARRAPEGEPPVPPIGR